MFSKNLIILLFISYVVLFTYFLHYLEPQFNNTNFNLDEVNMNKSKIKEILLSHPKMAITIMEELQRRDKTLVVAPETEDSEPSHERYNNRKENLAETNIEKVKEARNQNQQRIDDIQRHKDEIGYGGKRSKDKFNPKGAVLKPPEKQDGLGEMGVPVILQDLSPTEAKKKEEMEKLHSFNAYLSEKISLHRSLPDVRDNKCKEPGRYSSSLPSTSVIICFHNEERTALLRTVHSVLDRTRPDLLHEIILVDDFSSMDHLKDPLDKYMASLEKVRVIHTEERKGLVRARIIGAKAATSTILTYLDSHCEATEGWLEPLVDTVYKNPKTSAVPCIEIIMHDTFHFIPIKCTDVQVGGFDWTMGYTWHTVPNTDNIGRHPCDNVKSPTMAGGLFSINKKFFDDIGYYDEKLEIWGGENVGLSFKIWMCGGRIEAVPCSHVGHIFRPVNPYAAASAKEFGEFVGKNQDRIAEAWLDNHKDIYYSLRGKSKKYLDVSDELAIREKLQCKSFDWYLENVYPEQFVPAKAWAWGEVANIEFPTQCLDALKNEAETPAGIYMCHKQGGPQTWYYTEYGEIRSFKVCLDRTSGTNIILYNCHGGGGNQHWKYNPYSNEIRHTLSNSCLAIHPQYMTLITVNCAEKERNAKWKFEHVNQDRLKTNR